MTRKQIEQIIEAQVFPGAPAAAQLVETHISWAILSDAYAFKIKKPLLYSFLDFSTLEKRKFYCERELELNARFTSGMYLDVLPIQQQSAKIWIGKGKGKVVGYALRMKRLDNSRQMNVLLERDEVDVEYMRKIAEKLAVFHASTEVIKKRADIAEMQKDFADILKIKDFAGEQLGIGAAGKIESAVEASREFLLKHAARLRERVTMGFIVDGHGDLHSRNIFLLEEPVIFDCIEFNDHFRQIDLLSEIAFFCMDLDFYRKKELAAQFMKYYLAKMPCICGDEDRQLFLYYKWYRANVRLKVNCLKAIQARDDKELHKRLDLVEEYYKLFKEYFSGMNICN